MSEQPHVPVVLSASSVEDYALKLLLGDEAKVRVKSILQAVGSIRTAPEKYIRRERVLRTLLAAAGPNDPISDPDLSAKDALNFADVRYKEMTSPYMDSTRDTFTDMAHRNPILHKAYTNRAASFFKHGYSLELQLKSMTDATGKPLTPEQVEKELEAQRSTYQMHLKTLMDWSERNEINCLDRMRTALIASVVQGRTLALITPGINSLAKGQLPLAFRIIHTEDIGDPIVDTILWKVVAVRLNNLEPVYLSMPDQMVYLTRGDWGLRKESAFYGTSDMESVLQLAQIYIKAVNYDLAKAVVAAYLTKVFLSANVQGMSATDRETYLKGIMNQLKKHGTDILAVEAGVTAQPVPVTFNKDGLEFVINKMEELLIASGGSTLSQMGKTQGLTRDNATIQEIAFVEYIRVPDEELVKSAFEQQLFMPLLAHLAGVTVEELPVKVVIVRQEPDKQGEGDVSYEDKSAEEEPQQEGDGGQGMEGEGMHTPDEADPDAPQDQNMENKRYEIHGAAGSENEGESFRQRDARRKPFGAAGITGNAILDYLHRSDPAKIQERAVSATEKIARSMQGKREKFVRPGKR